MIVFGMAGLNPSNRSDWSVSYIEDTHAVTFPVEPSRVRLTEPPFEYLKTNEMIPLPQTPTSNLSDGFRTSPANTSEWVQQQSETMEGPESVATKQSPGSAGEVPLASPETIIKSSDSVVPQPKAYDITTLIALKEATPTEHMELRVHPGALAENVFKHKSQSSQSKPMDKLRRHSLFEASSLPRRSNRSEDDITWTGREWVNANQPYRCPQDPPLGQTAQQQEGFKRFLRQVASPPHNRVTAGGRIVPAGPLAPPPMMNFDSIENTLRQQPISKLKSGYNASTKSNMQAEAVDTRASSSTQTGKLVANQNMNLTQIHQLEVTQSQHPADFNLGSIEGNTRTSNTVEFPPGIEPLLHLQGGGAIVAMNGIQYRASWNGPKLILEPMQANAPTTITPEQSMAVYTPVSGGSQYSTSIQPVAHTKPQVNSTTAANTYHSSYPQPITQSGNNALNQTFSTLTGQLSTLDRHVALYLHKLSPFEHSALVTQRKRLVEQINVIRVRKDKNELSSSSSAPVVGPYLKTGTQPSQQSGNLDNLPFIAAPRMDGGVSSRPTGYFANNNHEAVQASFFNKASMISSTCLSPDAPPFVPSNTKSGSEKPALSNTGEVKSQPIQSLGNVIFNSKGKSRSDSTTTGFPGVTPSIDSIDQKEGNEASGLASDSGEAFHDPLPVVSTEEVLYAQEPGFNPADGKKLYCTTIVEFQEVIRRVREQASMYGCKGGQSKDPAFDAEQDVRWAMADHDPIVLPSSIPDHVINPRPWNWNDSIFNLRASNTVSTGTNTTAHFSSTYVAEKSRRVSFEANSKKESFNPFTHRRVDSWDSDPGENGLIDVTIPRKHSGLGLTAIKFAEDSAKGTMYKSKDVSPGVEPSTPSFNRAHGFAVRKNHRNSTPRTPPKTAKSSTPQSGRRPYQAYVEDDYGTPTSQRDRGTNKGSLARSIQKGNESSHSRIKSEDIIHDDMDPWDIPINPVYDWGSGKLISTNDHPDGSINPGYYADVMGIKPVIGTPEAKNSNKQKAYNAWAPVTDSKSRWGSEEEDESVDAWGVSKSYDWTAASVPKVNIPSSLKNSTSQLRGYIPPEQREAFKANMVKYTPPSSANPSSNNFLRGILKAPSHSMPQSSQNRPAALMKQQTRFATGGETEWERRVANKENSQVRFQRVTGVSGRAADCPSTSSKPFMISQDARVHKAQSSLASSSYHAHGFLPQSTRAGDYLTSSANQHHGYAPQYRGSVNQPLWPPAPQYDGATDYQPVRQHYGRTGHFSGPAMPQYNGY